MSERIIEAGRIRVLAFSGRKPLQGFPPSMSLGTKEVRMAVKGYARQRSASELYEAFGNLADPRITDEMSKKLDGTDSFVLEDVYNARFRIFSDSLSFLRRKMGELELVNESARKARYYITPLSAM